MADLIEIPVGDQNGVAHINENFSNVNKAIQDLGTPTQLTGFTKDGIVMHNGFTLETGSGYRYWTMPNGSKIVELSIVSKCTQDGFKGGEWFTVPDTIKADGYQIAGNLIGDAYVNMDSPTTVQMFGSDNAIQKWTYFFQILYFSK